MTDRELLEAAADAAGIPNTGEMYALGLALVPGPHNYWNPLANDGEALRLAVACKLTVCTDGEATVSASEAWRINGAFATQSVRECVDKAAATRRAIVRAAAEIGSKR